MQIKNIYWSVLKISRSNKITRFLVDICALYYYKIFRRNRTFHFNDHTYKYFYAFYNRTVASERIVEIPIAKKLIDDYKGKKILEVGNVMQHYFNFEHDTLDKYEKGTDVINEDIVDVKLPQKYDLIISVSTMEHVGHNYGEPDEPEKFLKGMDNLKKYLNEGGRIVITVPVNYHNTFMGDLIRNEKMPFTHHYYMKRISFLNDWEQTDHKGAVSSPNYDSYYANANAIYIGEYERDHS